MNEQDKNLKKAISELPSYEPASGLWAKIEGDMSFDQKISGELVNLPQFEPAADLWDTIEVSLDHDKSKLKRKKRLTFAKYVTGVAASITFIIMGLEVMFQENNKQDVVSYHEEVIYHNEGERFTQQGADQVEDEAIQFINKNCQTNNEICESPEFVELKSQLDELEAAISELDVAVKKYGKDPELIRTQVKLENLKSQVTKELIQKLNS